MIQVIIIITTILLLPIIIIIIVIVIVIVMVILIPKTYDQVSYTLSTSTGTSKARLQHSAEASLL